jgi:hypothetical protein
VFCHTHSLADAEVGYSLQDNREEPLLVENFQELEPATRVGSVVLGKTSQCGRL